MARFLPSVQARVDEILARWAKETLDEYNLGVMADEISEVLVYVWRTTGMKKKFPFRPEVSVRWDQFDRRPDIVCENDAAIAMLQNPEDCEKVP